MITEKTAEQIVRRRRQLDVINGCLGNLLNFAHAELVVGTRSSDCGDIDETAFALTEAEAAEWLEKMKSYEEERLAEWNAIAAREAQGA